MLVDSNLLSVPIIYPSYYFKKHHHEYYMRLDRVRTHGDFEGWIIYYLNAILESSSDAYKRTKDIEQLEQNIKQTIDSNKAFHKIKELAENALAILFQFPIISITELSMHLNKSYNTTNNLIKQFIENEILIANTAQSQRNKTYLFDSYLRILEKEY
jgi:Fic family protein